MATLSTAIMALLVFAAGAVWTCLAIRAWAPAARRRGGQWYLEAQILINGPLLTLCVFAYGPTGVTEPFGLIARALTLCSVLLAVITLIAAARNPRPGALRYVVALVLFYGALIVSGLLGSVRVVPEAYLTTPLVVISFVMLGDYTREWLTRTSIFALRAIVAMSFLAILLPNGVAFNTEEQRTLFGIERFAGITGHPNGLAFIAAVLFILEMSRAHRSKLWVSASLIAVALAQSSTAWLAVVAALLFSPGNLGRLTRWAGGIGALATAILAVLNDHVGRHVAELLTGSSDLSLNGRTRIWEAALEGYAQNPVFGYGPTLLDDAYRARYLGQFDAAAQAHNQFVQSLGSSGLFGVLSLVLLFALLLGGAAQARRRGEWVSLALLAMLLVRCITETPLRPAGPGGTTLILLIVIPFLTTTLVGRRRELAATAPDLGIQSAALRHDVR